MSRGQPRDVSPDPYAVGEEYASAPNTVDAEAATEPFANFEAAPSPYDVLGRNLTSTRLSKEKWFTPPDSPGAEGSGTAKRTGKKDKRTPVRAWPQATWGSVTDGLKPLTSHHPAVGSMTAVSLVPLALMIKTRAWEGFAVWLPSFLIAAIGAVLLMRAGVSVAENQLRVFRLAKETVYTRNDVSRVLISEHGRDDKKRRPRLTFVVAGGGIGTAAPANLNAEFRALGRAWNAKKVRLGYAELEKLAPGSVQWWLLHPTLVACALVVYCVAQLAGGVLILGPEQFLDVLRLGRS